MKKKLRDLIDPRLWEMSEKDKEHCMQHVMAEAERDSGLAMLTYEDAEPVRLQKTEVILMPVPREGFIGRIMDWIFGQVKKPQAVLVLDKEQQERLKELLQEHNDEVADCGATAEDIKEACKRFTVLARGHQFFKCEM